MSTTTQTSPLARLRADAAAVHEGAAAHGAWQHGDGWAPLDDLSEVLIGCTGVDPASARAVAEALLDALDPVRIRLRWSRSTGAPPTTCFFVAARAAWPTRCPDHGYCTSCPLVTDDERHSRLTAYLDEQAAS